MLSHINPALYSENVCARKSKKSETKKTEYGNYDLFKIPEITFQIADFLSLTERNQLRCLNSYVSACIENHFQLSRIETQLICRLDVCYSDINVDATIIQNDRVITCSRQGKIQVWDLCTGQLQQTLLAHDDSIEFSLPFTKDVIVTCSLDHSTKVWDLSSGECLWSVQDRSGPVCAAVRVSDSEMITCSVDGTRKFLDVFARHLAVCQGEEFPAETVKVTENAFAMIGYHDEDIRVWDLWTDREYLITGHSGPLESVQLLKNQKKIVTCSTDSTARIWTLDTWKCAHVLVGHEQSVIGALEWQDQVITYSLDGTARRWNIRTGRCVDIAASTEEKDPILFASIFEEHFLLTCSSNNALAVWDIPTGRCMHKFSLPTSFGLNQLAKLTRTSPMKADENGFFIARDFGGVVGVNKVVRRMLKDVKVQLEKKEKKGFCLIS